MGSAGGKHPKPPGSSVSYNARLELTRTGDASSRLMVFPDMWPFAVVIKSQSGRHREISLEPTGINHEELNFQPKTRK